MAAAKDGAGTQTAKSLAEETKRVLASATDLGEGGGAPSLVSLRRSVQSFISMRLSEHLKFLDRYGYLSVQRDGTLELGDAIGEVLDGSGADRLLSRVAEHFPGIAADGPDEDVEQETRPEALPPDGESDAGRGEQPPRQQESNVADSSRYERGEELGSGGLGVVVRAKQIALDRDVVLKEFRDVFQYFTDAQQGIIRGRLADVVRGHATLSHPHIVPVLDFEGGGEFPWYTMELCSGGNLRGVMATADRMPVGIAVQYFLQVAEALRYSHSCGIVHRNLKPENVLIDSLGNARVSDFGITGIVEPDGEHIKQVFVGIGTVAYLAPEQYQDARNASAQADVYSLGIMLYEMLTGKLPGRRSPMPSAYYEDIPRELDDIFDRMTMDFLDVRHATMDAVLAEIYSSDEILGVVARHGPMLFTGAPSAGAETIATPAAEAAAEPMAAVAVPLDPSAPEPEVAGVIPMGEAVEEPPPPVPADFGDLPEPAIPDEHVDAARAAAEDVPLPLPELPPPAPIPPADPAGGVASRLDDLAGDLFGDE